MKQQQSILQWASHVLDKQVLNLKAIQDVKFIKMFLSKIDDMYFNEWEYGGGRQTYQQVLAIMAKYFKEEIGTDLSQHFSSINLQKNVIEIWQLVLAIAIKGNNRNDNINIFFELDHQIQVELVTTVSNILDKFGQNTAPIEFQDNENEEKEKERQEGVGNDRKMVIELLQQNQQYRQEIKRLQQQLLKQRQDKNTVITRKNQLQHNLSLMKLQKLAFFEIMSHATNSESKIFQDNQGGVLQIQSNLSQLAQDIVQFILQQRNKISQQIDKNDFLNEKIRDIKISFAQQKQLYANQIQSYTNQLQSLRDEHLKSLEQNQQLINQIAFIQQTRADYFYQKKESQRSEIFQTQEKQFNIVIKQQKKQNRLKKKNTLINPQNTDNNTNKIQSSEESQQSVQKYVPRDSKEQVYKRQMNDQLRQHQLQKEITYLKKKIISLNKQNQILKSANEGLQRSAKTFMDSNKNVVTKWQDDYDVLIHKMTALNQINNGLKQQNINDKKQIANAIKVKDQTMSKLKQKQLTVTNIIQQKEQAQRKLAQKIKKQQQKSNILVPPQLQNQQKKYLQLNKESMQKFKKDKVGLWQQIVNKLKQIIRQGKNKQLSYQNSLLYLRSQNDKLMELLRSKDAHIAELKNQLKRKQASLKPNDNIPQSYFINIQKVQSQQMRQSKIKMVAPRLLSFIDADDGQNQDQPAQMGRKSFFYGVNSRIVNDFNERRPDNQHLFVSRNEEYYNNLNSKLTSSIRSGLQGINNDVQIDISDSVQLQRKMEEQIKNIAERYQKLNSNYQNVFNKLHIYTENLKQKQFVKKDYENVLEEITKAESEIKASHQAQIVKLRILNQALQQQRAQSIIQKQQFAQKINKLSMTINQIKQKEQKQNKLYLNQIQNVLKQLSSRYSQSIKDPLHFIQQSLSTQQDQTQIHKLYRLYIKQREKTRQLNEQLQLLSSVLLEYRNMIVC